MKCSIAEKNILLQDSGELGAGRIQALEGHLKACASCRAFKRMMLDAAGASDLAFEPSAKVVQDVLRAARVQAPTRRQASVFTLKPVLATAASFVVIMGLIFGTPPANKVGMVLTVTATQLLETEDQVVSIMYDGLSEDDLTFNFLMTYEDDSEG